ncbi:MAG: GGDEF domain-containing protein [Sedimentibacter sp.]|jgi:diguanylate cyclase (GGDEF)-like protein
MIHEKLGENMIELNPAETLLFNVGINTFSFIIALIIFYTYKNSFDYHYDIRQLRMLESIIMLILLSDIGMWLLDGKSGNTIRVLCYANIMFYFLMQNAATIEWLRYAYYRILGRNIPGRKEIFLIYIPFAILSIIVVTSPINGWCFYLDDSNYYHRGPWSFWMSVVILAYLLSISVMALIRHKKEVSVDHRKELLTLAFFVIPPFVGGVVQTVFYGISMIWPCTVISSLLILLNKVNEAISRDSLTGLNNRRNMERHLLTYEGEQNRAISLIIMDINDFKAINDQYGHRAGDDALVLIANILRTTFNGTSAFLARYGGDEFVVIIPQGDERTAIEAIRKIKNNIDAFNKTNQLPFQLNISAGYAISNEKSVNIPSLFKEADMNMYTDKALYHQDAET